MFLERDLGKWFGGLTKALLCLLIAVISLSFLGGLIKMLVEFRLFFHEELEVVLRRILIDALVLLAVVEILKTALAYLRRGSLRVNHIVDTVLIVMLSEVITLWFKGAHAGRSLILVLFLMTLAVIRLGGTHLTRRNVNNWEATV